MIGKSVYTEASPRTQGENRCVAGERDRAVTVTCFFSPSLTHTEYQHTIHQWYFLHEHRISYRVNSINWISFFVIQYVSGWISPAHRDSHTVGSLQRLSLPGFIFSFGRGASHTQSGARGDNRVRVAAAAAPAPFRCAVAAAPAIPLPPMNRTSDHNTRTWLADYEPRESLVCSLSLINVAFISLSAYSSFFLSL